MGIIIILGSIMVILSGVGLIMMTFSDYSGNKKNRKYK